LLALNTLTRRHYGETKEVNKESNPECIICFIEFEKTDEIAELKCDERHYFHYKCIELWFKQKLQCPLCKHEVI
jgi:hypothetical protein